MPAAGRDASSAPAAFSPLIMAAFFYPLEALVAAGAVLVLSLVVYEGYVLWRKRHRLGG